MVVREKVQNGVVSIEYIKNTLMLTDPLTKGLPPKLFMDYVARGLGGKFVNFRLIESVMYVITL